MLKITKMSDYAVIVLIEMMQAEDCVSVAGLAQQMQLPKPTISKVLKSLAQAGIVISTRGTNGGYSLGFPPEDISIEQIISAIDGPISLVDCVDGGEPGCKLGDNCPIRGRWDSVNTAVKGVFSNVSLADMAGNTVNLERGQL
ncbi:MAG: SUF system Fe-S cluster assembly regulator [Alphaproteobacteria bacterium]